MLPSLAIPEMLTLLIQSGPRPALIDVRSELEFAKAAVPGFTNLPILYQSERHEVGLTYKHQGQQAAIDRGAALVLPDQQRRLTLWCEDIARAPIPEAVVACWRGGMRSAIACDWLRQAGRQVRQLEGGYKALRHALLEAIANPPPLVIVTGLTGSGKTELLQTLNGGAIDLEAAAQHRGSAFGGWIDRPQPMQATFENALALQLLRQQQNYTALFCEDESRMIGALAVPLGFYSHMTKAPLIVLEEPLAIRTQRIFRDYILQPVAAGASPERVRQKALDALQAVSQRLSQQTQQVRELLIDGFAKGMNYGDHEPWLAAILTAYYDKRYRHGARGQSDIPIMFQGDMASCKQWCLDFLQAKQRR